MAKVILIPKPGKEDKDRTSSYRLICLISAFGKVFEYLVKGRIMEELNRNGGLSEKQFGFREGKYKPSNTF